MNNKGPALSERRRRKARVEGFTLVEILAAMMIFLVIATASYSLFDSGRSIAAHGEYEAKRFQSARAAIRALETDLKGCFSTTTSFNVNFIGKSAGTPERPLDTLEFAAFNCQPKTATPVQATLSTPPAREMDISKISYSIDEETTTEQSGLVRHRTRNLTEIVTVKDPNEGLEEIAADVVALKFRYYDGTTWLETWDSSTSGTLPKVVEANVFVKGVWKEKEELQTFTVKIYLPVAATAPKKQP